VAEVEEGSMRRKRIPRGAQQILIETVRVIRDPALFLWSLYILLFPIYMFKSGLPQPGDLLVVLLAPAVFLTGSNRLFPAAIPPVRALLLFTAYMLLVNLTWTVALDSYTLSTKTGFLITPTYYIYNVVLFLIALVMYRRYRERFLWLTLQLTLISVSLQVLISFFFSRGGSRSEVLFNNPNQLGYFAVLSASILCYGRRQLGLGTVPATVGLLASAYLSLLSSSKAALGATAILVIVGLLSNPRFVVVSTLAALLILVSSDKVNEAIDRTRDRLANDQTAGFFEERGYDRILNHKEHWFFGAGEGGYRRFKDTTVIGSHELHSSGGTIFFSYGIIGSGLFALFCWRVVRRARTRYILMLLPAIAFGLTHQGLRFTLLWVLLALFIALKDYEQRPAGAVERRRDGTLPRPMHPLGVHTR
jgi:hypothetical protein